MTKQPDAVPFLETKREEISGYAYETSSGQLVIDLHPSDIEHLKAKATHDTQPLYRCRQYVRDLMPKEWLGKNGKFLIDRQVTLDGEVLTVQISFIPSAD
jgi:hypothetical protein